MRTLFVILTITSVFLSTSCQKSQNWLLAGNEIAEDQLCSETTPVVNDEFQVGNYRWEIPVEKLPELGLIDQQGKWTEFFWYQPEGLPRRCLGVEKLVESQRIN